MMSGELFRTNIVTRDPRYPSIIATCNYALAGLFLGMFFTLSGVMLTAFSDQKNGVNSRINPDSKLGSILGLTMLISGCLLILCSVTTFIVASLMYLKTTTSPPETIESGEEAENVWTYLDTLPDKSPSRASGSTQSSRLTK